MQNSRRNAGLEWFFILLLVGLSASISYATGWQDCESSYTVVPEIPVIVKTAENIPTKTQSPTETATPIVEITFEPAETRIPTHTIEPSPTKITPDATYEAAPFVGTNTP